MSRNVLYIMGPSRSFAGIERTVFEILRSRAWQSHTINRYALFGNWLPEYRDLAPHLPVSVANADRLWKMIPSIARALSERRYELVIVAQPELCAIVSVLGAGLGYAGRIVPYLHGHLHREQARSRRASMLSRVFCAMAGAYRGMLVVSPSMVPHARAFTGFSGPIIWVKNPIRPAPQLRRRRVGPINLVTVGRLSPEKGITTSLLAVDILLSQGIDCRLTIVGDGPERTNLEKVAASLGAKDRVSFIGYQSSPHIHLQDSDIYLCTSRWEGFGNSLIEALSAGVPLVLPDVDFGPKDIWETYGPVVGSRYSGGDPAALACAVKDILSRKEDDHDDRSRREISLNFDPEIATTEHVAAISGLIDEGNVAGTC